MIPWAIWYHDGRVFEGGKPEQAPAFGVVCIAQPHARAGRHILSGWDWYYWHPVEREWWGGAERSGILMRLLMREPMEYLLHGSMVSSDFYHQCLLEAGEWHGLPRRSARVRGEEAP